MISNVPSWVEVLFILTTVLTVALFYFLNSRPKLLLAIIVGYGILQSVLANAGFYQVDGFPPRPLFVLLPTFFVLVYGLTGRRVAWAEKNRNLKYSYFLHTIRIPVEIVLLQLFLAGAVPELMTFEGRNFDILIGIIAPFVGYYFMQGKMGAKSLLVWNIVGLVFVLFIVVNAVLSISTPFQLFGFDQPNVAVNYFPFVLLPAVIVPVVIYTHLSDILILRKKIKE